MRNIKTVIFVLILALLAVVINFAYAAKPSGNPPSPWWSPRPTTAQQYIDSICNWGDSVAQEWCTWLKANPNDVPSSYYTVTQSPPSTIGTESVTLSSSTVSSSEFDETLIKITKEYLTRADKAGMSEAEMKDLAKARQTASGATIDLSGKGANSGANLADIYNKAKNAGLERRESANVTVKTLAPEAFPVRYGVTCGNNGKESINSGETKYYKIDMTKWIDWQRTYAEVANEDSRGRYYRSCMSVGKGSVDRYNKNCKDNKICAEHSCWPECPADRDLAGCGDFVRYVMVFGSSSCSYDKPDFNYADTCYDTWWVKYPEEVDKKLAEYEKLYKSGNYNTIFSNWLNIGCNPYAGSWGCDELRTDADFYQANTVQLGLGYNQIPVYENIKNFNVSWNSSFPSKILDVLTAVNPIVAISGDLVGTGSNSTNPMTGFEFNQLITGASNIYLMVHNKEGAKRDFILQFSCPSAKAK